MRILFDLLCAQPNDGSSKFHGGGEYAKTIFERMTSLIRNDSLVVFYNNEKYIDEWVKELLKRKSINVYDEVTNYNEVVHIFDKEDIDVFYSPMPYFDVSLIVPKGVLTIGTFHGLRGVEKPTDIVQRYYGNGGWSTIKCFIRPLMKKYIVAREYKKNAKYLKAFDRVVCVSNHTKYAIKSLYPKLVKEIKVFYTPSKYIQDSAIDQRIVKEKYILIIGCNRWEKNGYRFIKAMENLRNNGQLCEYKVVTVGEFPRAIKKRLQNKDYYIKYDYVQPKILENLYYYCDFFVFISMNEGFGMPPLEAMKYGKTCVVSGVASLPEVCGEAAYYCNPYDIGEIQNRLLMASMEKIPPDKIIAHADRIRSRQVKDLDGVCEYILGQTR